MTEQNVQDRIKAFLDGETFAVAGATSVRSKYGNKVLRVYQQNDRTVYPVNPRGGVIEGLQAYHTVSDVPEPIHGLSIITPPKITEQIVDEALELGIRHFWMQPGAESDAATQRARDAGAVVIPGDACILVVLGYRESA